MARILRPGLVLLAALLLTGLVATAVLAQETFLDGKLRAGDTVVVRADETVDGDLYLFAATVTVNGNVDGDVSAFGRQVTVNGDVAGDLLACAGTVNVNGTVEGDVRIASGLVTVAGDAGEDLVMAAGQATLSSGGSVGGDVIVSGGTVMLDGSVAGSVEGSAGTYTRDGSVGGTEHVAVAPEREADEAFVFNRFLDAFRQFAVVLLFGAVGLWLLPRGVRATAETLRQRPLLSLGGGALGIIGYVVAMIVAILLMILLAIIFGVARLGVLVGIELTAGLLGVAGITFLFVLAVVFAADVVVGLALGHLVTPARSTGRLMEFGLLAAGAAVVVIVTSLPAIGGWAKLVVVMFGLGAICVAAFAAWRARREPPTAAGVEPGRETAG